MGTAAPLTAPGWGGGHADALPGCLSLRFWGQTISCSGTQIFYFTLSPGGVETLIYTSYSDGKVWEMYKNKK